MDLSLPCQTQRLFTFENGTKFVIINLMEDDTVQPYTAKYISDEENSENIVIKINLKFQK